jgi:hypothetical protein
MPNGRSGRIDVSRRNLSSSAVTAARLDGVRNGGAVETTSNILTIKELANILRCSKTHALNVLEGKVRGLPKLTHLSIGRRKVVRKDWLDQWMEANKSQ